MALNYKSSLVRYRRYLQIAQAKPTVWASAFVIMSLVLLIVMLVFALRPTLITIADLSGQIQQNKDLSDKLNEKIAQVQQASSLLNQIHDKLRLVTDAVPATPAWSLWLSKMEFAASSSGVKIQSASLGPVQLIGTDTAVKDNSSLEAKALPEQIKGISFNMVVAGQYEQLKGFIERVENNRRLVVLTSLLMSKDKDGKLLTTTRGVVGYDYVSGLIQ